MTKSFFVLATAAFWWCASASPLAGVGDPAPQPPKRQVTFLGSEDNPPFLSRDEAGNARGVTVEFLKALGREGNFEVVFDLVPRAIRREEFRRKRGDVTGVQSNSPEARDTLTLVPFWQVQQLLLFAEPRPAGVLLTDLRGEKVAVMADSNQHRALDAMPPGRRPVVVPTPTMQMALEMLRAREVTAVFGHSLALRTARGYRDGPPLDEHQLEAAPIVLATRSGQEELLPLFASAYLRLQNSGELNAIMERALTSDLPRSEDDRIFGLLLLGILGLGAVSVVAMLVWSRSLRRQGRQRTEELQRASEHQKVQAHVLSQVADAIVVTDVQGLVTSWNAGAEAIFGRRAADAIGQPVASLITNRMAGRRGGDIHAALSGATNWRGDAEIVRPAGDTVIVEATLRSLTDEHGQPSGTLIVAHDVDARRKAELDAGVRARQQAAIASLGQRALAGIDFRWLIDQAMSMSASILQVPVVAAFELDRFQLVMRAGEGWDTARPDGFEMRADRACYPGVALAAHGGVACIERGDDSPPLDALHMREGITAGVAVVIPGRSGPYGLLLVGDRRLRQFSRDDIHFLQAIANVIGAAFERSVIDADLRAELAMHHATLEAAADGILVTDTAGRARRYNQRLVSMWGFPEDVLTHAEGVAWVRWQRGQLEEPGFDSAELQALCNSPSDHSLALRLKDGRVIERHSQPQLVDGKIDGRVWCYRDVTDRVRAEEERRRLEAQMQHVQKLESLGVLAGGIAHDFNNLLVGMLGHAGLALTEVEEESPAWNRIMQIQITAQRAAELTNQMLAYSGKGRVVLQAADLSDIVGEMTHLLRTAVEKNADIVLDLHPSMPAFDGDPAQIRQVIMNLITNASDAIGTSPGTITVQTGEMKVTREYLTDAWIGSDLPEGEYVFAEVRDTGCGMDAATLARIFDPFFTTKFTGRGLGLAAVLGIVRGHKGGIKITSTPGQGTTFRVLLPSTTTPVAPVVLQPATATVRVAGARVLVVDDEAGVRTIARESLKRAGFDVTTVNDGAEAVELLSTDKGFHVVLLDMTMPRMNGTEAFKRIKEMQPDLPVVLTSGYSAQEAVGRFGNDGLVGFIQKPFMPSALVKAMDDAISQRPRQEVA